MRGFFLIKYKIALYGLEVMKQTKFRRIAKHFS